MNLKFFTTALLATGATAAFASEQNDALIAPHPLQTLYEAESPQRQRRFWVRIIS